MESKMFDQSAQFDCAYCGCENVVEIDISAGLEQEYIEDCEVCCRPNQIKVHFDETHFSASLEAQSEV
jgi:transcription elongation factor Elf1